MKDTFLAQAKELLKFLRKMEKYGCFFYLAPVQKCSIPTKKEDSNVVYYRLEACGQIKSTESTEIKIGTNLDQIKALIKDVTNDQKTVNDSSFIKNEKNGELELTFVAYFI